MSPNLQFPADLVTFSEGIFNGKLHFLYSVYFVFISFFAKHYFLFLFSKTRIENCFPLVLFHITVISFLKVSVCSYVCLNAIDQ